jgi:ABC-type uncharacterized transport system auxiliary subunit
VHTSQKCLVNQREVHRDTHGFNEALRSALREDPDYILVGELRDFQADYDTANAPPLASVRIMARLLRLLPDRAIVASQSFAQAVRADGTAIERVVVAFDQALGTVAGQVVDWTLRAPGTTLRPGPRAEERR